MRIRIVCPAPRGTRHGNRVTAVRWARILRELGHRVSVGTDYQGAGYDLLIALHAKRSAAAVFDFHERHPAHLVIVALTGTDLYRDLPDSAEAQRAVEIAARLVVLQPLACEELAPHWRAKTRVIYQSVAKTNRPTPRSSKFFDVCVVGHLRAIKDPFRAAMAARGLPPESRIQVVQAGAAMNEQMHLRARLEEQRNPRYVWLGDMPYSRARRLIASSHLLVLSSVMEGGANVISEAIVDDTPVLASRIPGSVGLLGDDYPGLYRYGDTEALRRLMLRAETDRGFYAELRSYCAKLAPLFDASRERAAWNDLISGC